MRGFLFANVAAKLRYIKRPDLALIVSDGPCVAAGVFTKNRVKAAPVLLSRENLRALPTHRAVLLNAGRANACTGKPGLEDAKESCEELAKLLNCDPREILLCSTGIIGQRIRISKLKRALPGLVQELEPYTFPPLARAIMTTDTYPKYVGRSFSFNRRRYNLAGIAKGAGMIAPDMATMLSVVVTDAPLSKAALQQALSEVVDKSFNAITIDGDTSTNDTLLLLSSGAAGGESLSPGTGVYDLFVRELGELCLTLAKMIAMDGEGATKFVTIRVLEAKNQKEAAACAKTIANSPLVKTAFAGEDPNWGRILAAAGRSGARFNPNKVRLDIGGVRIVSAGKQESLRAEKRAHSVMKKPSYEIALRLGAGKAQTVVYTCDLTEDYVEVNADYRS
ncbi:MAG: bifunctional glutamate N-acetyltransferase/amino-acid acetyltransferase ArgJ [Bdellovibrionota bacterium]